MVWKMFKTKDMIVRQDNRHGLENIQNKDMIVRHVFINNFQLTNKNHSFKSDCKCFFIWPFMQRWQQCPSLKGNIKTFFLIEYDFVVVVVFLTIYFHLWFFCNSKHGHFWSNGETRKKNIFRVRKTISSTFTVEYQAVPSLHGGLLEIPSTVH